MQDSAKTLVLADNENDVVIKRGSHRNASMFYVASGSLSVFVINSMGQEQRVMRQYQG